MKKYLLLFTLFLCLIFTTLSVKAQEEWVNISINTNGGYPNPVRNVPARMLKGQKVYEYDLDWQEKPGFVFMGWYYRNLGEDWRELRDYMTLTTNVEFEARWQEEYTTNFKLSTFDISDIPFPKGYTFWEVMELAHLDKDVAPHTVSHGYYVNGQKIDKNYVLKNGDTVKEKFDQWIYWGKDTLLRNQDGPVHGFYTIGDKTYYFNPDSKSLEWGFLAKGFKAIGDNHYFFNEDTGAMETGWKLTHGAWRYFESNGQMKYGWLQDGNATYYLDNNGMMVTGDYVIDGKTYTFAGNGALQGSANIAKNGWQMESGAWYYYKNNAKQTGWVLDGTTWYYMNAQGKMQTGWLTLGNTKYYLSPSGAMLIGKHTVEGKIYTFNASGALVGDAMPVAKNGWKNENGAWYYYKNNVKQTGWLLDGSWYYLRANGTMYTGWLTLGSTKYYLSPSGVMVTGYYNVNGVDYVFSADGALLGTRRHAEVQEESVSLAPAHGDQDSEVQDEAQDEVQEVKQAEEQGQAQADFAPQAKESVEENNGEHAEPLAQNEELKQAEPNTQDAETEVSPLAEVAE